MKDKMEDIVDTAIEVCHGCRARFGKAIQNVEETLLSFALALSLGLGSVAAGAAVSMRHEADSRPALKPRLWHRLIVKERELIRRIRWVRPRDY